MKADLTRNTFHPNKHFARVLMQQGRVQLDADWNEQAAVLLRYIQSLAEDLIGPFGGPRDNCGFQIAPLTVAQPVLNDFVIGPGHYYVDGILCELSPEKIAVTMAPGGKNSEIVVASWTVDGFEFAQNQYAHLFDSTQPTPKDLFAQIINISQATSTITLDQAVNTLNPVSLQRITTYLTQPDLPVSALPQGSYEAYLDVWERVITYVEDDAVREVALNGADTAARTKVVWQVRVMSRTAPLLNPANRGYLKARSIKSAASADPCIISPAARYQGPENQLYRVEVHTGSHDQNGNPTVTPTFKWSRENGAVVFPIMRSTGTNSFVLETLGRDDRFGLAEKDWVEIQDDDSVLLNRAENLLQVQSIDRLSMTVTLAGTPSSNTGKSPSKHPLLRRWDQQAGDPAEGGLELGPDNAAKLVASSGPDWLELENGVQIQFQPPVAGQAAPEYRTGDYWLIPARTATGDVEWPAETVTDAQGNISQSPVALPPQGIQHHYAPLANVTVAANGAVTVLAPVLVKKFPPAAV
jgi:hypothetical protein